MLISFEGLRADDVGGASSATPHFDRFVAEGAWAGTGVASASWCAGSMASIMTGVSPARHGVAYPARRWLRPGMATLAEVLTAAGYVSRGFYASPWLGPGSGLERGFEGLRPLRRHSAERWLAALPPGPSLTWVQLPLPGVGLAAPSDRDPVREADRRLGRLLDALRRGGRYDEAMVIVLADHGRAEQGGEPALLGADIGRASVEVPLAIRLPAALAGRIQVPAGSTVGLDRIFATVLELTGSEPLPVVAPSLLRPSAWAALSELWFANGYHEVGLHEDGHQLRWRCRFAAPDDVYDAARLEALGPDGSALYGSAIARLEDEFRLRPRCSAGEEMELEAWTAGGGVQAVDDGARRDSMLKRLRGLLVFPPEWSVEPAPEPPTLRRHDLRALTGWGLPVPGQWRRRES